MDAIKDAVGEIVSDLNAPAIGTGLREAFARIAAQPSSAAELNPSHCPYCAQPMPRG